MQHQRIRLTDADGAEVIAYLTKRTPLDGQGGARRQGFDVMNRHYEDVGRVTRHRDYSGRTVQWSAHTPGGHQTEHHSRGAALIHLIDQFTPPRPRA